MDAVAGAAATQGPMPQPDLQWESDTQLKVEATSDGLWNGVAFWFEVRTLLLRFMGCMLCSATCVIWNLVVTPGVVALLCYMEDASFVVDGMLWCDGMLLSAKCIHACQGNS